MGWDCPGAVQFCAPELLEELAARSTEFVSTDESAIASRLRRFDRSSASWSMPEEHWSLGGQQDKFALAQLGGQWLEAHGSSATTHIFKPGVSSLMHQALVEHLTMRAAGFLGINVARTEFLSFEDQWAIVITRFDRHVDSTHTITRIHQEDFAQALGRLPEFKYEAARGPRLQDMSTLISRDSMVPVSDRLALADFALINAVAGAPDGHAKNIALLRLSRGSTVAPLFDLATGLAYESNKVDRTIALSIGGEREIARIYRKQLEKMANVLHIDNDAVFDRTVGLARDFPTAFHQAATEVSTVPGVQEVLDATMPRLIAHTEGIISRLE